MAFAGLKKQINKANQYVTEKMGGAEGTKLDMDFMEMERKTDVTVELVEELQIKTKEYLQPNPTARAKMAAVKGISKLSGQAKTNTYPQPEGLLADCMLTYGKKLGEDSIFAQALVEFGESLKQMADVKYSLDDNIKQNFLEPLHHLQTKDLKEVMHHRKKLQGRRLDFDCKRRRQAKGSHITDDEIRSAEDKFAESLHLAQMGMFNLLENDVEQISQLVTFSEALLDFHSQCAEVLKGLTETLQQKRLEAEDRPKPEFTPKTLSELNIDSGIPSQQQQNTTTTGMVGTNGGANRHGGLNGIDGIGGGGISGGGSSLSSSFKNSRHYPPSRFKENANTNTNTNNMNSHHQFMYSSQQNLSTIFNNNNNNNNNGYSHISNNNNNNNNNNNFDVKNSNFNRNRVYGSHQSLSKTTTITTKQSTTKPTIINRGVIGSGGGGGGGGSKEPYNIDLNSIDWLNAWNNPPPNIPSASNASTATTTTTATTITTTNNKAFNTATTANSYTNSLFNNNFSTSSNNKQLNNFNSSSSIFSANNSNNTRTINARFNNDPWTASPLPSPMRSPAKTPATNRAPCCTALYDFEPENPGELGFKENDVIQLLNRVDENWYEGSVNGRTGYFPQSYVEILVPLPN